MDVYEVYTGDQEKKIVGIYISEEEKGYIDGLLFVLRSGAKREAWNVVNHTKMFMNTINKHGINFLKDIDKRRNTEKEIDAARQGGMGQLQEVTKKEDTGMWYGGRKPAWMGNTKSKDPYDHYTDSDESLIRIKEVIEWRERNIQLWESALKNGCLRGRNIGKPLAESTRKNYERHIHCAKWEIERLSEKLNDLQRPLSVPVLRLVS